MNLGRMHEILSEHFSEGIDGYAIWNVSITAFNKV
jgi:hypothetical protein